MIIKVNKKGELNFPILKFFSMEDTIKIVQYSLDFRDSGNIFVTFYDKKGKIIKPTKGLKK